MNKWTIIRWKTHEWAQTKLLDVLSEERRLLRDVDSWREEGEIESPGDIHVLQRTTDSSYPIKVLYGLSIPQMVGSKKIGEKIEDRAVEILDSRVQHEIDRLLGAKW